MKKEPEFEGGGRSWWHVCPECHTAVTPRDPVCPGCGQELEWENKLPTSVPPAVKSMGAHQPRVLTLKEALESEDPVYFESEGQMCLWCNCVMHAPEKLAEIQRFDAAPFMLSLNAYGKTWRCWNGRPDEALRRRTEWH